MFSYATRNKGKSLLKKLTDYVVLDLETSGMNTYYDDIIEVGALRVRNGLITERFQKLIKPRNRISSFITSLTGITNSMLKSAGEPGEVLPLFIDFIGSDIVVGHNVNFDINFVYDNAEKLFNRYFDNSFVDTLRLARRLLPELKHHRLFDLTEHFNIEVEESHRALADCMSTLSVFKALSEVVFSKYGDVESMIAAFKPVNKKLDISSITAECDSFDISHPLYGKVCVFTGALEKMKRADAMQLVVNMGGIVANGVTKQTNYLVLGNNDFCKSIKDGKSNKQKKAEALKLSGQDIEIISEYTFYEMIEG